MKTLTKPSSKKFDEGAYKAIGLYLDKKFSQTNGNFDTTGIESELFNLLFL
jgi:hypothetical protein